MADFISRRLLIPLALAAIIAVFSSFSSIWILWQSNGRSSIFVARAEWYKGSYRWAIAPLRTAVLLMENTRRYQLEDNIDWQQLVPPDGGEIYLEDHSELYTISFFHQLRCLNVIRESVVAASRDGALPDATARHCLNYLRQMVLCRAGAYLEAVPATNFVVVTGPRTCQDWSQVYDSAKKNNLEHKRSSSSPRTN